MQTLDTERTLSCLWPPRVDHAQMLVMIPREPDPKVRHDGRIPARKHAEAGALNTVNERGHMHGASRINPTKCQDLKPKYGLATPNLRRTTMKQLAKNRPITHAR